MADANADIIINVDTSIGIAEIKNLQRQIAELNAQLINSGAKQAKAAQNIQRNLINNINATGKFAANVRTISTTAESFTTALEKNKFSMGEYFKYAGASTKTFGRLFKSEFNTIQKVAEERVKTLQTQYIKLGRDANGAMKAISVRPLALDMDDLATKTALAAQKQQLLNQLLKQGSTNLLNFGKNTQWAGRQLMVGFTIPLAYLGTAASKTFMQMEEQALKFKRVYGELFTTQAETDEMVSQIQNLAKEFTKYGVAASKTMEMAAEAAAMGKMGADLLAQVAESTRLAVLGNVEASQALETTISVTNAFGIAAEDLAGKIDFLNSVENQTVTSIEDLTVAIPKAAPVIKQLGGNVEDLAFFLTAMKEGGINASEGANALKSGLASMINPTGKAAEFLESFGINLKGIVEANKGDVKGMVVEFASALDTLDPLNRARAIEQLFGKFQFARISTLFQNVIAEGSQAQRVLKLTNATTEELAILSERELKRIEDSPMYKFKAAVEDLKTSLIPLGEAFLKAVTPIVEFAKGFLDRFNEMGDGAKQFAVIATTVVAGIGPVLLMTFGLVANGVANLIKLFTSIGSIFSRTGKSSADLGMQTQYMTQEQLEAASVAASLDQAHAKLIQTFSVEAAAVDKLATAYNRATAAQARQLGLPTVTGGKGKTPKKYNSGVVSVPGPKGAGDIVPAMLAPGEAVIPADMARKHAPLISGMINDNLPGYRIGLNPFASMLSRSRVAVRTKQEDLIAMLQAGKAGRYKSAFETNTGADYIDIAGRRNVAQELMRSRMEEKVFGLGPNTPASARPTYGYARTSPIQALINRLFGFKGRQYNAVTTDFTIGDRGKQYGYKDPKTGMFGPTPDFKSDTLERYGDIDIITRRSVARRSQAAVTDALMDFNRMGGYPGFRLSPVSMRGGKGNFDNARFDRLSNPFGTYKSDPINSPNTYTSNPKPPYVETYTPGGFGVKEISKIVAKDRSAARELQKMVDSLGLRIRVTPQNAPTVVKALANMFGTRFFAGTVFAGEPRSAYSLDFGTQKDILEVQSLIDTLEANDPKLGKSIAATTLDAIANDKKINGRLFRRELEVIGHYGFGKPIHETAKLAGETAAMRDELRGFSGTGSKETILDQVRKDPALRERFEESRRFSRGVYDLLIAEGESAAKAKAISGFDPDKPDTFHGTARGHIGGISGIAKRFREGWDGFTQIDPRTLNGFISDISKTKADGTLGEDAAAFRKVAASMAELRKADVDDLLKALDSDSTLSQSQLKLFSKIADRARSAGIGSASFQKKARMISSGFEKSSLLDLPDTIPSKPELAKRVQKLEEKMFRGNRMFVMPRRGVKKYKSGVVSVPGPKGKGDIVPAMLSPGEAVIPAEMSKKYSPLISGMISDSIPGYFDGNDPFDAGYRNPPNLPNQSQPDPFSAGYNDDMYSQPSQSKRGIKNFASSIGSSMVDAVKSPKFRGAIKEGFLNAGEALAKPFVTRLAQAGGNTLVDRKGNIVYDANTGTTYDKKGNPIAVAAPAGGAAAQQMYDEDGNPIAPQGTKLTPKQQRKQAFAQAGQKMGMAGMGVSMLAGAATMMPGAVGETAQQFAGPLMALSSLTMLIQGPVSAIFVALAATVGAVVLSVMKANEAYAKAREEAIALRTALGGSTEAIRGLSDFAGRVTAGEVADRRRQNKFRLIDVAGGKSTFGESFIKSEAGAALLENINKQVAQQGGNTDVAKRLLADQLKMGVVSGAVSLDEASSIAAEIGSQLGDASIGIKIRAEIQELIGPNGEDLSKDPVTVATRLATSSIETMGNSREALQSGLTGLNYGLLGEGSLETQGARNLATGGMVAASAGAGAGIGAALGAIFAVPTAGLSIGVGAVIGTIAGAITGFMTMGAEMEKISKQAGAMAGAYIADATTALQQQTEIMDVLDKQYEQKLREAEAEGDITKYKELQLEYDQKKNDIAKQSARIAENVVATYDQAMASGDTALAEATLEGMRAAADVKYKDDPTYALYKPAIDAQMQQAIDNKQITGGQEILLRQQMLTGDLDPAALSQLLTTATKTGQMTAVMNIVTRFGGDTASEMNSVLNMIKGDDPAANTARVNLIMGVSKADGEAEANKLIDFALDVQALGGVMENSVNTFLNYYEGNSDAKKALQGIIDNLAARKVTTVDLAYEVNPILKETGKLGDAFNEEYFDKLKTEQEKETYVQTISTILNVPAPQVVASDDFKNWLADEGAKYGPYPGSHSIQWWARTYAESMGQKVTETGITLGNQGSAVPPVEPKTPSGGPKEDPYEDVLKRLKEVRNASINAQGGLKELNRILGGSKDLKIFNGIEQQLISKGANRGFIDWVLGQDSDIQKKFIKINKGIVTLTNNGRSMAKAFNEIAMGDFQAQQKQITQDVTQQNVALRKIVNFGVSYGTAYEIVADAATATAIAQAKDKNEIKQIIAATQERIRLQKKFNELESARATVQDTAERNRLEAQIKSSKKFGFIEQEAILSDDALMTFFKNKNWTGFNQRMAQLLVDPEFMARMFEDGLSKAQEQFAAKEEKLRINAEIALEEFTIPGMTEEAIGKGARGIIAKAQNDIANLQYNIDDWEASLKGIEDQEEKINERYDDKFEALDRIQKANNAISEQQRSQLDLADALSRGDIAGAARAEQQRRQRQAAEALDRQRESLENAREAELAALNVTVNGQKFTRAQIEEKIKNIQKEIFDIEEKRLEPAQKAVRESEYKLQKDTAALEVAGKTKLEWEQIANNVETAKTNSNDYDAAIQTALGTVSSITAYWDDLDERKITTYQDVVTTYTTVGTPPVITGDTEKTVVPTVTTRDTGSGGTGNSGSGNGSSSTQTDGAKDDIPESTQSQGSPPPYSPGAGNKWQWNDSKKVWEIVKAPVVALPGSSKELPIKAEALDPNSTPEKPQTLTVGAYKWFRVPPTANVYSVRKQGTNFIIQYGKKPDTFINSQGKRVNWHTTELGGAHGNSLQATDSILRTEAPASIHKDVMKRFPADAIGFNAGGLVPARFANMGSDIIPAMLAPGEFVMRKYAVDNFGVDNLKAINSGAYNGDSVYNYEVNVNVSTDANPDQIANAVMSRMRQIDSQRLRGNRF